MAVEPVLPTTGRSLTRRDSTNLFLFVLALQNLILLIVGSGPLSLFLLTVMETTCFYLMSRYGKTDINAAIILAIALAHLIVASFVKIAMLQSLDENLSVPLLTELITLVYFIFIVLAFFTARRLPIPKLRPAPEPNLKTLEWLIVISTVMMLLPLANRTSSTELGPEGPTNFLLVATRGFATVAMVAAVIHALKKSGGRKFIDSWSAPVLAIAVLQGLASNSREGVLAPLLAALVTPLYQGYRFGRRTVVGVAVLIAFVALVISPALLIVRGERAYLNIFERLEKTAETAGLILIGDAATTAAANQPLDMVRFSVWGRYFGKPVPFADRIALIQTTDALAAAAAGGNYVTIDGSFGDMIAALFPNFMLNWFDIHLERTKATTDIVAGNLGLTDPNAISFLAIPLDAEAYATGGFWPVIYKTFFTYLLLFYVNRLGIGRKAPNGLLPVSLLLIGYHVSSEADAGSILYFTLRVLPQFLISFHVVSWIARVLGTTPVRHAT